VKYVSDMLNPNLKNPHDRAVISIMRKEKFLAISRLYEKAGLLPYDLRNAIDRLKAVGYLEEREFLGSDVLFITKAANE